MKNQNAIWLIKRLREPSTWAGVAVLLQAFNVPAMFIPFLGYGLDLAVQLLPAAAAGAAIVMAENNHQPGNE